jgi:hypothetical protein
VFFPRFKKDEKIDKIDKGDVDQPGDRFVDLFAPCLWCKTGEQIDQ